MKSSTIVVTIDGPAGAGKSTTAKAVAERLGFTYLDSGALYRAAALKAIEAGIDLDDGEGVARLLESSVIRFDADGTAVLLDGRDVSGEIRTDEVSQAASRVSASKAVRAALVKIQRAAACPPGTVVEGRDMGTVIFPDAAIKVYLDADPAERALRRTRDLETDTSRPELATVRREMAERDERDSSRAVAPLKPAEDALVIDSTSMSIDEVVESIVMEVQRRRSGGFS